MKRIDGGARHSRRTCRGRRRRALSSRERLGKARLPGEKLARRPAAGQCGIGEPGVHRRANYLRPERDVRRLRGHRDASRRACDGRHFLRPHPRELGMIARAWHRTGHRHALRPVRDHDGRCPQRFVSLEGQIHPVQRLRSSPGHRHHLVALLNGRTARSG